LFNARFQHGFDAAYQHRGQEGDIHLLRLNTPIAEKMSTAKTRTQPTFRGHPLADLHRWVNRDYVTEAETFCGRTGATAVRWLEENYQGNPFFLWVDFFDPHEPWDPPEYLVRRYDPDYMGPPMFHPNYGPASAYTPEELHNLWAHYAAESELVDRMIGRIVQKIDDLELWDDTIVAVTSDHGMSLGEHNRTGKSNITESDPRFWPVYPEIGHVPFFVGGGDVPRGERSDIIAQPVDILPTLCELAGAEVSPPDAFQGTSFADTLRGGRSNQRSLAVSGCCIHATDKGLPERCVTPFVVTDTWGYAPVGAFGQPELYNVGEDPLAVTDVAADNAAVIDELHEQFLAHLRDHSASDETLAIWEKGAEGRCRGSWAIDYPDQTL